MSLRAAGRGEAIPELDSAVDCFGKKRLAMTKQALSRCLRNISYLTDERWEHVIENHPELEKYHEEVLSVIRSGKRKQDILFPDTFYYTPKAHQIKQWNVNIEVVVLFQDRRKIENRIILW